jgi:hypothetical protein
MAITYKVGDLFTTQKSHVTGRIVEVVALKNAMARVKLQTPAGERWTTVTPV